MSERWARVPVMDLSCAQWRKSSRSGGNGACVEIAGSDDGVAVRDSKDRGGPVLVFTPDEWRIFAARVKAGRFDLQR
jgi:Domain of unknown function (DUF397)